MHLAGGLHRSFTSAGGLSLALLDLVIGAVRKAAGAVFASLDRPDP